MQTTINAIKDTICRKKEMIANYKEQRENTFSLLAHNQIELERESNILYKLEDELRQLYNMQSEKMGMCDEAEKMPSGQMDKAKSSISHAINTSEKLRNARYEQGCDETKMRG